MDAFPDRHAYRCLPLSVANSHGWELLLPFTVDVTWTGGSAKEDLIISSPEELPEHIRLKDWVHSNFTRGIITFFTYYIFRTPPGWNLWVGGSPNRPKEQAFPLTAVIETWWLPYTFTMNWQITTPGTVRFSEGEPYCFIYPVPTAEILTFTPLIRSIDEAPELKADQEAFAKSRSEFLQRIADGDRAATRQGWQKTYFSGKALSGEALADHIH